MKYSIPQTELTDRIRKNEMRLHEPYYQLPNVYQAPDADWPADKEGRALLAFVSHYRMHGRKNPCMEEMLDAYEAHANEKGFLGPATLPYVFEQQLSGHSWLLRGLCEYHEAFSDEKALEIVSRIVQNLYLPLSGKIGSYPVTKRKTEGGVSGNSTEIVNGFRLSTDIGCTFMSIDGLSHAYQLLADHPRHQSLCPALYALLDEMILFFDQIDKIALRAQTHCSLTAARGMLRMAEITGKAAYIEAASRVFRLYTDHGMSLTYQNLNWWGRPKTWTEPCAIVDSLMLAVDLFKITRNEEHRHLAARIYHNGFAAAQRANGGAGTDSVVIGEEKHLFCLSYEASFCCTMRFAEGLRVALENRDILSAEMTGELKKDAFGRYMDGDILYCEILSEETLPHADAARQKEADGHTLYPLPKFYHIPDEIMKKTLLRVVFDD